MRLYGNDGTIHNTKYLDIETNKKGQVVAVWFRCQTLPFKQSNVDEHRSKSMVDCYTKFSQPEIHAVILDDKEVK